MDTETYKAAKMKVIFIAVIVFSAMLANFVLWSGFALGFFITVLVGEILIFTLLPFPKMRQNIIASVFFGLSTAALALTYLVYSEIMLMVLNFFVIVLLLLLQLLIHSEALESDWNTPKFAVEILISPFVRPFRFLPEFINTAKTFRKPRDTSDDGITQTVRSHTGRNIFLGLLAALPVLAVVIALLSSADIVFGNYFKSIIDFIRNLNIGEVVFTVILGAFIFPFLFSFVFSYVNKWKESSGSQLPVSVGPEVRKFGIEPVFASTFLFCVNIVYGLFTWVQFSSLFGALAHALPEDLTYAEYAREGFFQLAFVACINVVLVIVGVMATNRNGPAGVLVRVMSVLMIAFTYVLLVSAAYRMKMYISVFALTKLRLFVSIFMVLIAAVLLFALIKEFFDKFKFFKFAFVSAVVILLASNFLNPSYRIAEYNIQYHGGVDGSGSGYRLDTSYLVYDLSFDAVPVLFDHIDDYNDVDRTSIESGLVGVYGSYLKDYREGNWRKYNVSKERAKILIEVYFGDDLAAELEYQGFEAE
ncbi:MAG: DUF4173 domain-containing protein [Eubacteriales bacterium]|nr:DUF4173 domain-containing protein [Eubacteriales bacterium]